MRASQASQKAGVPSSIRFMAATAALRAVPRGAFGEGSGVEADQGERRCMAISSCGASVFGGTVLLRGARSAAGQSASDHRKRSDITSKVSQAGTGDTCI